MWSVGYASVSLEMDSVLNVSPKISDGALEWDVKLQNYMLRIL